MRWANTPICATWWRAGQPGDREKAQQGLAQMRRRHQQMPEGSEEGADG